MLHLAQGNPKHRYRLGREEIESSLEEEVFVDEKLNIRDSLSLLMIKAVGDNIPPTNCGRYQIKSGN